MSIVANRMWWIGGSPCSGKSTLAGRLADALTARVYSCDDAFERHSASVAPDRAPTLQKVRLLRVEERLRQPISEQVADVFRPCHEQWPQILADVDDAVSDLVVEGSALLPELLAALGIARDRAAWIVPTERFKRRHYARRRWARDLVNEASEPEVIFDRWMQRDARFADEVAARARWLGFPVLVTSTPGSIDEHEAALNLMFT